MMSKVLSVSARVTAALFGMFRHRLGGGSGTGRFIATRGHGISTWGHGIAVNDLGVGLGCPVLIDARKRSLTAPGYGAHLDAWPRRIHRRCRAAHGRSWSRAGSIDDGRKAGDGGGLVIPAAVSRGRLGLAFASPPARRAVSAWRGAPGGVGNMLIMAGIPSRRSAHSRSRGGFSICCSRCRPPSSGPRRFGSLGKKVMKSLYSASAWL